MNVIRPGKPTGETPAIAAIDGEIRDFVRRDVAARRTTETGDAGEVGAEKLTMLLGRVSSSSIGEIDRLIAELKGVRDFLHAEGERVQREITAYSHVSQTAMASVKIIMEGMGKWKDTPVPRETSVPSPSIVADRAQGQK